MNKPKLIVIMDSTVVLQLVVDGKQDWTLDGTASFQDAMDHIKALYGDLEFESHEVDNFGYESDILQVVHTLIVK